LDLGGTFEYWERVGLDFLRTHGVRVTILNLSASDLPNRDTDLDLFQRRVGDACDLSGYGDQHFELTHSNSVIEHLETWVNMKRFAAEARRVSKSYYIQTPYYWFPIDPHYYKMPMFHWFPRPIRARLLNWLPIATSGRISGVDMAFDVVDRARLLDGRQFKFLFPDADITYEKFLGMRKSMIAILENASKAAPLAGGDAADNNARMEIAR
jgi:hypothetical protein